MFKITKALVKGKSSVLLKTVLSASLLSIALSTSAFSQNLLKNSYFSQIDSSHTSTSIYPFDGKPAKQSGGWYTDAANWTTWVFTGGTIATELLPSTSPRFTGQGQMFHVTANGGGGGIVQVFGAKNTGPNEVTATVWLYVLSGSVCVGVGNGGNTHCSMTLTEKNKWEKITVSNGVSPANEIIIYAAEKSAEFYVDSARVVEGPSWETQQCYIDEEYQEFEESMY